MHQSELLQSKVIEAHEELWRKVVGIRRELPSPYSTVLGLFFSILTPEELVKARGKSEFQFSMEDEAFIDLMNEYNLDLIRPYIDNHLWEMATARIRFAMRLLILFSVDNKMQVELTSWPEDQTIVESLLTTFSQEELERFSYSHPGTFREILNLWESRVLAETKKALFEWPVK